MKTSWLRPAALWKITRKAIRAYWDNDTSTLGAALSYYTAFSTVPVLFLVVAFGGFAFGADIVSGAVTSQIQSLLGEAGAKHIGTMVDAAWRPGKSTAAALVATAVLLVGATAVFGQLRTSLNTIWDVKPKPHAGYVKKLLDRVFSFAMVVCLAFLLLVSLAVHAALTSVSTWALRYTPESTVMLFHAAEFAVSLALTVLLFAIIYKFMSDAQVKWRDVWVGSALTALLFALGKYAIGAYLAKSSVADTYGVASSIVLVLLWVYYSSQILFFGAEFTQAFAAEHGRSIGPGPYAVRNVTVEVEKPKAASTRQRSQR